MPPEPRFQTIDTSEFADGQLVAWNDATKRFAPIELSPDNLPDFTEAAQDAAALLFTGSTSIVETYDDAGDRMGLEVNTLVIAPLASPAFTGTPTAPTAAPGTNTNQIATMAAVKAARDSILDGAPLALDTLKELATQLQNDENAAAALTNALAGETTARQSGDSTLQSQLDALAPVPSWLLEWNDTGGAVAFDPATLVPLYRVPVYAANGDLRLGANTTTQKAWVPFAGGCSTRLTTQLFVAGTASKTISLDVRVDNAARLYLTPAGGARAQVGPDVLLGSGTVTIALALQPGWNLLEAAYANTGGTGDRYFLTIVGQDGTLASLVNAYRAPIPATGGGSGGTLATQIEAQAGTENTHLMTPLRTAQAIAALGTGGGVTGNTMFRVTGDDVSGPLGINVGPQGGALEFVSLPLPSTIAEIEASIETTAGVGSARVTGTGIKAANGSIFRFTGGGTADANGDYTLNPNLLPSGHGIYSGRPFYSEGAYENGGYFIIINPNNSYWYLIKMVDGVANAVYNAPTPGGAEPPAEQWVVQGGYIGASPAPSVAKVAIAAIADFVLEIIDPTNTAFTFAKVSGHANYLIEPIQPGTAIASVATLPTPSPATAGTLYRSLASTTNPDEIYVSIQVAAGGAFSWVKIA